MRGQLARVGDELRQSAPRVQMVAGPFVPSKPIQAVVKTARLAQIGLVGAYVLGENLFASSPRLLRLLSQAHENRFPLGVALYLSHLLCEMAYSTAAFEITYNGHELFSKRSQGRYPNPGEISQRLLTILAAEAAESREVAVLTSVSSATEREDP